MIFDNPKNFYNEFIFNCTLFANGNFQLCMSKPKILLRLIGTYERDPKEKNLFYLLITDYMINQGPEKAHRYQISAIMYHYDGTITLYDLNYVLTQIFPIPKTFDQDTIIDTEKNREGDFHVVYLFNANGNFEMCLSEPKCKLRLLGTYERDPCDKTECDVIITRFQMNDIPSQEYKLNFTTRLKDEGIIRIQNANLNDIVFSLCNLNFDSSSLVQGQPFNNMCQARNRYYNAYGSRSSYDSEDLRAFLYPDGIVKIQSHIEKYEDWGTDYSMDPSCSDYFANGNYIFSEKTSEREILVSIKIEEPKNYAGREIEAKINQEKFTLLIK